MLSLPLFPSLSLSRGALRWVILKHHVTCTALNASISLGNWWARILCMYIKIKKRGWRNKRAHKPLRNQIKRPLRAFIYEANYKTRREKTLGGTEGEQRHFYYFAQILHRAYVSMYNFFFIFKSKQETASHPPTNVMFTMSCRVLPLTELNRDQVKGCWHYINKIRLILRQFVSRSPWRLRCQCLKKKRRRRSRINPLRDARVLYVRACHKDDWPVWPSEDRVQYYLHWYSANWAFDLTQLDKTS